MPGCPRRGRAGSPTSAAASARTTRMTTSGVSLPWRSSWRRCSTYCISSFSCGASRSSRICSLASGVSAAKRSANSSMSGRPFTFQVLVWVWQNADVRLRPELAVRDAAGRARRWLLDRLRFGQPRVQVGAPGALPSLCVQTAHTATGGAVTAAGHPAALVRLLPPPPRIGRRDEPLQGGHPSSCHRCRCPSHRPRPRAVRPHPATRHSAPPNTGSSAPNSRTSLRNSLRTSAISLPSSPDGPAGFSDGAVTAAPARR